MRNLLRLVVLLFFLFQSCQKRKVILRLQEIDMSSPEFEKLINDCVYVQSRLELGIGKMDDRKRYPADDHFVQLILKTTCFHGNTESSFINLLGPPTRNGCVSDSCVQTYLHYSFQHDEDRKSNNLQLGFENDKYIGAGNLVLTRTTSGIEH